MKNLAVLAILAIAVVSPNSIAGDFFAGAQWGQGTIEVESMGARTDLDDNGFKGYVGYKFKRFFALEVGYTDLGSFEGTLMTADVTAEADLVSGTLLAILPASERLQFFVKLGVADWNYDVIFTEMMAATTSSYSGTDTVYGAGFSYKLGNRVAFRGEWETYDFEDVENVKFGSIGLVTRF